MDMQGCWTAVVTPFSKEGDSLDLHSLERLVDTQIQAGITGLVVCGSTGEAATLTDAEYDSVIRAVVTFARTRVPVIAGVGTSSTHRGTAMAAGMKERGVSGILVVAPPYNKPPQAGIIEHVRAIGASAGLPVCLYNIPGRTGVNIAPSTIATLFDREIICAVKESSGSIDQVLEILTLTNGELPVLSGEDTQVLPVIASGGRGVISASSNLAPSRFVSLTNAARSGDLETARREQYRLLPLIKAMFVETNPIPVKEGLRQRGILSSGMVRLPLVAPQPSTVEKVAEILSLAE